MDLKDIKGLAAQVDAEQASANAETLAVFLAGYYRKLVMEGLSLEQAYGLTLHLQAACLGQRLP